MCGDYHLATSPNEKDALLHTPGGATQYEQMGLGSKTDRMDPFAANPGPMQAMQNTKEFDKLEMLAKVQSPPPVKFKDLEEVVSHKINVSLMPFEVRTDYVKITGDTVLVPVTLQIKNKDITFVSKDGIQRGTVNIFGRVTGITGRSRRPLRTPYRWMCRKSCWKRRWNIPRSTGRRFRCAPAAIASTSW